MQKHILVTGGAGYIGSHACKALSRADYTPVSYDNLERGHKHAVKWGPLVVGDIKDQTKLSETFSQYSPLAVMHFAAYAYVDESIREPEKYFLNNEQGSKTLIDCALANDVNKFIFSSSCTVYGEAQTMPVDEAHPCRPINAYGESKHRTEQYLAGLDAANKARHVSLRYFNAAGADPDGEAGEEHDPETHLIPLILLTALGKRKDIKIFGSDYNTPDGTCVRDYVHVSDLADAHVLALDRLLKNKLSATFNLGNGSGYSIKQVIEATKRVTGIDIATSHAPRREGDLAEQVADASRAINELGWEPKHAGLEDIIETAWRWHKSRD